ncbi:MAG: hypothetical protein R8F63_08000 [Acidimicrobiales bacterium]|nr:hypothetical protein [Acidimicrobiales bacterium]
MIEPGGRIIAASWTGTAVFAIAAGVSTIDPDSLGAPVVIVSLVLFGAGAIAMFWAFLIAVARSTEEAIGIGGLYFGAGSAPRRVQAHLMGSLALQLVIAFTTASIRIFTALAFGILVPVWGLGMAGLWCARHGTFAPRGG